MEFVCKKENYKKSGIYSIINVETGKYYIGSCKNFYTRYRSHLNKLKNNKHFNKHLQSSYNTHGAEAFVFSIVELVTGNKLDRTSKEEEILTEIFFFGDWETLYNFRYKTTTKDKKYYSSNPTETKRKISVASKKSWESIERRIEMSDRVKNMWKNEEYRNYMLETRTGQKRSEETKKILSEQKLGEKNPMFGKIFSKEHRDKMSKSRKGKKLKPHSKETRDKISAALSGKKRGPLSEKTKRKISIANSGKPLSAETKEKLSNSNSKIYDVWIINMETGDKLFLHKNAKKFCLENGLSCCSINKLINKKIKTHKNWKLL